MSWGQYEWSKNCRSWIDSWFNSKLYACYKLALLYLYSNDPFEPKSIWMAAYFLEEKKRSAKDSSSFLEIGSVQLATQELFPEVDSIQLMNEVAPENIDSSHFMTQARNHSTRINSWFNFESNTSPMASHDILLLSSNISARRAIGLTHWKWKMVSTRQCRLGSSERDWRWPVSSPHPAPSLQLTAPALRQLMMTGVLAQKYGAWAQTTATGWARAALRRSWSMNQIMTSMETYDEMGNAWSPEMK